MIMTDVMVVVIIGAIFMGILGKAIVATWGLMVPGIVTGIVVTIGIVATIGIIIRTVVLMVPVMTTLMGHSTLDATLSATLKSLKS